MTNPLSLYPCPFCMTENVEIDETSPGEYAVCCQECRATGPISEASPEDAIRRWNASADFETGAWINQIGSV